MLYGQLRFKFKMFQKQVTPFLKYILIIVYINALKGVHYINFINHNRIVIKAHSHSNNHTYSWAWALV